MKTSILPFIFLLSFYPAFAQMKIKWQKCFGGSGGENASRVAETLKVKLRLMFLFLILEYYFVEINPDYALEMRKR